MSGSLREVDALNARLGAADYLAALEFERRLPPHIAASLEAARDVFEVALSAIQTKLATEVRGEMEAIGREYAATVEEAARRLKRGISDAITDPHRAGPRAGPGFWAAVSAALTGGRRQAVQRMRKERISAAKLAYDAAVNAADRAKQGRLGRAETWAAQLRAQQGAILAALGRLSQT